MMDDMKRDQPTGMMLVVVDEETPIWDVETEYTQNTIKILSTDAAANGR